MSEGVTGEKVGVLVGAAVSVATTSVLTIDIDVSITSVGLIVGGDARPLQDVNIIPIRKNNISAPQMIFIISRFYISFYHL